MHKLSCFYKLHEWCNQQHHLIFILWYKVQELASFQDCHFFSKAVHLFLLRGNISRYDTFFWNCISGQKTRRQEENWCCGLSNSVAAWSKPWFRQYSCHHGKYAHRTWWLHQYSSGWQRFKQDISWSRWSVRLLLFLLHWMLLKDEQPMRNCSHPVLHSSLHFRLSGLLYYSLLSPSRLISFCLLICTSENR